MRVNVLVAVPRLGVAEIDLHHAHAAFDQSAGEEASAAEIVVPITLVSSGRLLRQVKSLRGFHLHPERHFHRLDPSR